ncbi:hypothetical protein JTB14_011746 [Gonioctena quinquepunctata]|nr:hypothetical protein JTB14_011746 [Gonioctena quinquepunctata]
MSRYEEEQQKLQKLLQECFSDEEDMNDFEPDGTSDEFELESDIESDSSIEYEPRKKKKVLTKISGSKRTANLHPVNLGASTSSEITQSASKPQHNISDTIEDVIQQMQVSSSGDEEDDQQVTHGTYVWGPVTGSYLKKFDFLETENGTGFKAELYETMYNKTPYDFYKLFVNDDIINLMVTETNRYADQCIEKTVYRNARVNSTEEPKFIAVGKRSKKEKPEQAQEQNQDRQTREATPGKKLKTMVLVKTLLKPLKIPILYLYSIPTPNHNTIIPPEPFLVVNSEYYQYVTDPCPLIHDNYHCQNPHIFKELETPDCTIQILKTTSKPISCHRQPISISHDVIEQINDVHYIVITTEARTLDGTYLLSLPQGCSRPPLDTTSMKPPRSLIDPRDIPLDKL